MTKDPNTDWEGKYRAVIAQLTEYGGVGVCGVSGEKPCTAEDLNMNDVWGWAFARCPIVPESEVEEVCRLFKRYGRAGLLYWHAQQEGDMRSELRDNSRVIDFVENEERMRKHDR